MAAQKEAEKKVIEEVKKEEFQKQLAKLEHVRKKLERERQNAEQKPQDRGALHWQAKVKGRFISDIVESFEIRDRAEKLIDANLGFKVGVKNVLKICTDAGALQEREEFIKTLFEPRRKVMKFYGNSPAVLSDIIATGRFFPSDKVFRKRNDNGSKGQNEGKEEAEGDEEDKFGLFGYGAYFTSASNASVCHCGKHGRFLLYCEVNIGKALEVTEVDPTMSYNELTERGYDSVYVPRDVVGKEGIFYEQFVVYHPFQALPLYLIEYELL